MAMAGRDPWVYQPPLSLWRLVEQNVSLSEQDELKNMLGESLVDTTLELHEEVEMLLEIWRDFNEETESDNSHRQRLAEPPHIRDRLVQEIAFLADNIRDKSLRKGMNPSAVLSKHNSEVLEYAEESRRAGTSHGIARPMSARSADGRQTPLSPNEQVSSRQALSSSIAEDVASSSSKFNYMQFDEVCNRLRETLTQEMEQLKADVNFLQACLDDAAECRSRGVSPALSREPTIAELREERSLLEKDLLSTESLPKTPVVHKPAFQPNSTPTNIKNLGPVCGKLRPVHASHASSSNSGKAKPLKASHTINRNVSSLESCSGASAPDCGCKELSALAVDDMPAGVDRGEMAPAGDSVSPEDRMSQAGHASNRALMMKMYDFKIDIPQGTKVSRSPLSSPSSCSPRENGSSASPDHVITPLHNDSIRRRDAPGTHRRRTVSPARVKVVPVTSILEPQDEMVNGRPFMPTPPPSEKPQLARPNSAERFRKMVLQYREST